MLVFNLDQNRFTPSLLYCLEDKLLHFNVLNKPEKSYIPEKRLKNHKEDFFLSPMFTPSAVLQRHPKTTIFCGERDPMIDDCVRFGIELKKSGVRVEVNTLRWMSHAFLPLWKLPNSDCLRDVEEVFEMFYTCCQN